MYKLYWSIMTGVIAPQILLEEVGADYEKIVVDVGQEANFESEYLAVNPMAQVPAMQLPDGTIMTESAAMMLHITDCYPEAKLAPTPGSSDSAVFLRWLIFMAASLYTTDLRLFYPDQFTNDPSGEEGVKASGQADMDRFFGILNDALEPGPYLLGQTFSAVDIYLWMLAGWHPDTEKLMKMNPRIKNMVGFGGSTMEDYASCDYDKLLDTQLRLGLMDYCGIADVSLEIIADTLNEDAPIDEMKIRVHELGSQFA